MPPTIGAAMGFIMVDNLHTGLPRIGRRLACTTATVISFGTQALDGAFDGGLLNMSDALEGNIGRSFDRALLVQTDHHDFGFYVAIPNNAM